MVQPRYDNFYLPNRDQKLFLNEREDSIRMEYKGRCKIVRVLILFNILVIIKSASGSERSQPVPWEVENPTKTDVLPEKVENGLKEHSSKDYSAATGSIDNFKAKNFRMMRISQKSGLSLQIRRNPNEYTEEEDRFEDENPEELTEWEFKQSFDAYKEIIEKQKALSQEEAAILGKQLKLLRIMSGEFPEDAIQSGFQEKEVTQVAEKSQESDVNVANSDNEIPDLEKKQV